ncbi:MAG: hypothetical protein M0R77_01085 [Gammaproteobacteria bacterium]|nr:hypothetical protein [Acholeplasmataceae bacterium]MCK9529150.1 hypothetical protein [Gammaproteobacteria bacterium]
MDPLVAYKEKLLPILKKTDLLDDVDRIRTEYTKYLIPELERNATVVNKPKDKDIERMFDTIHRIGKISRRDNALSGLSESFKNTVESLDKVQDVIKKEFTGEQIATDVLTYRQVALIRYVEISNFVLNYSLRLLRFILSKELDAAGQKGNDSITPNERTSLNNNFVNYASALPIVTLNASQIDKTLKETPSVVIDEAASDVLSFHTAGKADPTKAGLVATDWNPLYHSNWNPIYRTRLLIAEWQAKEYRKIVEELKMFEVQRLRIENARQGRADPILDKRAEELGGIINDLQYEINRMEKNYA